MKGFKMKLPLIRVDIGNNQNRWFWDEDEAIIFASGYYNTDTFVKNRHPIFEHGFSVDHKDICKFLNEMEIKKNG